MTAHRTLTPKRHAAWHSRSPNVRDRVGASRGTLPFAPFAREAEARGHLLGEMEAGGATFEDGPANG
jgi:hypothetical protein